MAYITKQYIIDRYGEKKLTEITATKANPALIDETVINKAIIDAGIFADSFLNLRYTVPITPTPNAIQLIIYDITIYYIYRGRNDQAIPEQITANYNLAVSLLKNYRKGDQAFPDITQLETGNGIRRTNKISIDRVFDSTFKTNYRKT